MQTEQMQTARGAPRDDARRCARSGSTSSRTRRSWRMTRRCARPATARRWRARASARGAPAIRRLPQLSGMALSILRNEGPGALAERVRAKVQPEERFKPGVPAQFRAGGGHRAARVRARAGAPLASIVIPVYGKPLLTYTCLKSVHANTPHDMVEVIVVDDASPEPAAAALAGVTGVRFERNSENLGFIGTCNRGAELARGEFVVFLNNDTIVTPGWLEAHAARVPRARRTPGSSAPSSSIRTAGCRRRAASSGATARRGTGAATTTRTGPSTTTCARPTTARARASRSRRSCSASSAASTRATRPRTTRTPTSRSPCARRAARCTTSRPRRSCTSRGRRRAPTRPPASSGTRS